MTDMDVTQEIAAVQPLTIKTMAVEMERRFDLGDFNSLKVRMTFWADVSENANIGQAASGMRELARNHIIAEASRVIPQLRARAEHLYMGKPVVGTIDDLELPGERFLTGSELSSEVQEMLVDCGLDPADVIVRQVLED